MATLAAVAVMTTSGLAHAPAFAAPTSGAPSYTASEQAQVKQTRAEHVARQRRQLAEAGIPKAQLEGWSMAPRQELGERFVGVIPPSAASFDVDKALRGFKEDKRTHQELNHPSFDALRLTLGLPAIHKTIEISDHRPRNVRGEDALVYKFSNKAFGEQALVDTVVRLKLMAEAGRLTGINFERGFTIADYFFGAEKKTVDQWIEEGRELPSFVRSEGVRMGSSKELKVRLGEDKEGSFVEYYGEWNLEMKRPDEGELRKVMSALRTVARKDKDVAQLLETVSRVGIPRSSETIDLGAYYGKPLVLSEKIYFDEAQVKTLISRENELSGYAAWDFLMWHKGALSAPPQGWKVGYQPDMVGKGKVSPQRDWLVDHLDAATRAELAKLDAFYSEN